MTHNTLTAIRFLTLATLLAIAPQLHAAGQIQVHWNEVCRAAHGNQLTIKTADGQSVDGYCVSINVDEISVKTKENKVVKIARTTLSRIDMQRSKNEGRELAALGKGMHKGLRKGVDWLFSPFAPLGIVTIPVTVAWGAVAAPFCILGDLAHDPNDTQEIQVI
ncbi:MAG TPA: hypothetical protein VGV35_21860 [Bryobacteraceae bacterium]|nr:hypothetical protein [Bryobacteraceae bacterium]